MYPAEEENCTVDSRYNELLRTREICLLYETLLY